MTSAMRTIHMTYNPPLATTIVSAPLGIIDAYPAGKESHEHYATTP